MYLLLYAGILYLIMVGAVLVARPSLMFNQYGGWKEFGIGRGYPERYTWMPFWLYAIFSAIMSYTIVLVLASNGLLPGVYTEMAAVPVTGAPLVQLQSETLKKKPKIKAGQEMAPGYYILDAQETARHGIPKYVYLGPEPPNLIYNAGTPLESTSADS